MKIKLDRNERLAARVREDKAAMLSAFFYIWNSCEDENGEATMPDLPNWIEPHKDAKPRRCSGSCRDTLRKLRYRLLKK